MRRALAVHNELLRRLIDHWGGYEVKTEGDAFMVAFSSTAAAVRWGLAAQLALLDADWPEQLLDETVAGEIRDADGELLSRGLRVRMGIHTGEPELVTDPTTGRADYYGPVVNRAARIAATAQGGQLLVSGTAWALASAQVDDVVATNLGRHRLKGLATDELLVQVLPQQLRGRMFAPIRASAPRTNLPLPAPAIVGRTAELARVMELFDRGQRLISIVGPGGIGKSSLARRLGYLCLERDPSAGAWFADLSAARSELDICRGMADTLAIALGSLDEVAQVAQAVDARGQVTIILDNFEQIVRFAASTIGRWLAACPRTRFLVTSREPLRLPAEAVVELGPLSLERRSDGPHRFSDGAELFVTRAKAISDEWEPTSATITTVEQIAGQLEGIPLAIELAASRIVVLSPEQILERLGERFALLREVGGSGRALRSAFDWSWELLTPAERSAFAQCSVFVGGWTMAAAEGVVSLEDDVPVLDVIESLRAKSMIRTERAGGRIRFSMYETSRDYARDRLREHGDQSATMLRHARYFGGWAKTCSDRLRGPDGVRTLRALAADFENFRYVIERARTVDEMTRGDAVDVVHASTAIVAVLGVRGPLKLQRAIMLEALDVGRRHGVDGGALARLAGTAWEAWRGGPRDESQRRLRWAIDQAAASSDREAELLAVIALAVQQFEAEDPAAARETVKKAGDLAETIGTRWSRGLVLLNTGIWLMLVGDTERGSRALEEATVLFERTGDRRYLALARANFATIRLWAGRPDEALAHLEPVLSDAVEFGDALLEAVTLENIGDAQTELGLDEARATLEAAAELSRDIGDEQTTQYVELDLAKLHYDRGEIAAARSHLGTLMAITREQELDRKSGLALLRFGVLLAGTDDLDSARLELAQAITTLRETRDRTNRAAAEIVQACVLARLGELDDAESLIEGADSVLTKRAPALRPLADLGRAELHLARGDEDTARACLAGAAELARRSTLGRALTRTLRTRLRSQPRSGSESE